MDPKTESAAESTIGQPSPESQLNERVAIVTGANAGIGLATATALASAGATVACVVRSSSDTNELDSALTRIGRPFSMFYANLDEAAEAAGVVDEVVERLGRVDILINNAGITDNSGFLEQTLDSFEAVLALDLRAPFILIQAAGRVMADSGRGGRIINISSSVAFRALHSNPAYASAKGGLNALTLSAAGALGAYDITVNAVVPGPTATKMARVHLGDDELQKAVQDGPLRNLLGRVSTAEDVAAPIVFLCTDAARQITGQLVHVSAGAVV